MKSEDHLQRLLNAAQIDTPKETDQRILAEAAGSIVPLKHIPLRVPALAAIVVLAVGVAIWTHAPRQPDRAHLSPPPGPGQILTMESLKQAYNQEGMEALDRHYETALGMVGLPKTTLP